jgi:hypothetical protein
MVFASTQSYFSEDEADWLVTYGVLKDDLLINTDYTINRSFPSRVVRRVRELIVDIQNLDVILKKSYSQFNIIQVDDIKFNPDIKLAYEALLSNRLDLLGQIYLALGLPGPYGYRYPGETGLIAEERW